VRPTPLLESLVSRRLLVVSGKGGVGKTTVAAALAKLAAEAGRTTLLVSTDGRGDATALFGKRDAGYQEAELAPRLHGLTADFDTLLADFVGTVAPVRALGNRLLAVPAFRFFTRATPGLPDLLLLGKIREIFRRKEATAREPKVDLVVLDAPATGHALSLVALPRTLLGTVPAGPVRKLAEWLDALLEEPKDAALVVVSEPEDFAAKETEELIAGARQKAGLSTALVVVNRVGRSERKESLPRKDSDIPLLEIPEIEIALFEENDSSKGGVRPRPGARPASDESDDQRGGIVAAEASRFFEEFVTTFEENAASPPREASRAASARRPARESKELFSALLSRSKTLDLRPWLDREKLIVLTGSGGVGKTTLAAALGLAAARRGRRALVLTVDPARRLAQALGISERDARSGRPSEVSASGIPKGGRLLALQIDPKATFERLLARTASPEALERIRGNRLYSGLVDSLPGVLEYMGVEALHEHAADPEVDLLVLDTPPAARGLDFLAAPERMVTLLENDALRFFLRHDGLLGRALSEASRGGAILLRAADRVLGLGFLADLADFFRAFDGLYDGFKERSREAARLLAAGRFLVATTTDFSALATSKDLAAGLARRGAAPGLILNRVSTRVTSAPRLFGPLAALPVLALPEMDVPTDDLPSALASALAD
jgi:anion-transporting  ArsA/GET3 family ATPase